MMFVICPTKTSTKGSTFSACAEKYGKLLFKGEKLLKNIIRFIHRNVGKNIGAYIYSSINVDMQQCKQIFVLNTRVEEMNARDIAMATVRKGPNKKFVKSKLDRLRAIKTYIGLANIQERINIINGNLELAD